MPGIIELPIFADKRFSISRPVLRSVSLSRCFLAPWLFYVSHTSRVIPLASARARQFRVSRTVNKGRCAARRNAETAAGSRHMVHEPRRAHVKAHVHPYMHVYVADRIHV